MLHKLIILYITICFLPGFSGLSWGQAGQTSGVDIIDRERARTQPQPLSQPHIKIEEDRQPSEHDAAIQFTLNSLRIEGATIFAESELLSPYTGLYRQRISFETLNAITAELTKKYRDSGYILSRVFLPAQDVDQNSADIRLFVVEGFIASVQYEGDQALVARFQKRFASVERKLLAKKPLKHADFEREMLILQDLKGINVSSRFQESSVKAGSILILEIKKESFSGSVSWNNSGTESAGRGILSASFSLNSLPIIGLGTTVSYSQANPAREYYSLSIYQSYQFVNGFVISASFNRSFSPNPDTEFARTFDYKTKSKTFNLNLSYPVIRGRDLNLSLGLGYEHRNSYADLLGDEYTQDRLRNLSFNANFDFSDEFGGVNQAIATLTQGVDAFSASDLDPKSTNTLAKSQYFKADLYLSRNQQLPFGLSLLLTAEGMISDKLLASYNRFSFGGSQFGRGYESGTLEGDNALAFSFEPRWTYHVHEKVAVQPFAFIDYGRVWTNLSMSGVPDSEFGSSVGFGLRLFGNVGQERPLNYNFSAYWGKPIKTIDDQRCARFVIQGTFYF
jgi:hemolysin activation/secretion protein